MNYFDVTIALRELMNRGRYEGVRLEARTLIEELDDMGWKKASKDALLIADIERFVTDAKRGLDVKFVRTPKPDKKKKSAIREALDHILDHKPTPEETGEAWKGLSMAQIQNLIREENSMVESLQKMVEESAFAKDAARILHSIETLGWTAFKKINDGYTYRFALTLIGE